MQFGVVLPRRLTYASAASITSIAEQAESLGYDSIWTTDHIAVPERLDQVRGQVFYEALITLAYVGRSTTAVELGTSVLALPAREPLLAKQLATLDG